MLYSDSVHEKMPNAVNESFRDAHGVEIGASANFDPKTLFEGPENFVDWMLGEALFSSLSYKLKELTSTDQRTQTFRWS